MKCNVCNVCCSWTLIRPSYVNCAAHDRHRMTLYHTHSKLPQDSCEKSDCDGSDLGGIKSSEKASNVSLILNKIK
jgi:hypothetical protein